LSAGGRCKSTTVGRIISSGETGRLALPYFAHIGSTMFVDIGSQLRRFGGAVDGSATVSIRILERA
jgi:hypothetical protein